MVRVKVLLTSEAQEPSPGMYELMEPLQFSQVKSSIMTAVSVGRPLVALF